jgi:methylated-DNA-protein-cysteine methyltransferase related protein
LNLTKVFIQRAKNAVISRRDLTSDFVGGGVALPLLIVFFIAVTVDLGTGPLSGSLIVIHIYFDTSEQSRFLIGYYLRLQTRRSCYMSAMNLKEKIYALVRKIPRGRVSTYGDIAAFAGSPRAAREVGWALSALPIDTDVPWWRVINAQGAISPRSHDDKNAVEYQAAPLRREKIQVSKEGTLALSNYRWRPRATTIAATLSEEK